MSALVSGLIKAISAYLDHKLLDHSVERRALVVQRLARLAQSLLASAESTEVLGRLGHEIRVQLHVDSTKRLAAKSDVEEDAGARGLGLGFGSHIESCREEWNVLGERVELGKPDLGSEGERKKRFKSWASRGTGERSTSACKDSLGFSGYDDAGSS